MLYIKKRFSTDDNNKKHHKVRDHCHYTGKYRGVAHRACNLRYETQKEIPVVLRNGSSYDYHFLIKELAEKFEGEFECLGENTKKYITFFSPIKKEITAMIRLQRYHTKESLLIALDLCQVHYQILLIIYLEDFIGMNAQIINLFLTI